MGMMGLWKGVGLPVLDLGGDLMELSLFISFSQSPDILQKPNRKYLDTAQKW